MNTIKLSLQDKRHLKIMLKSSLDNYKIIKIRKSGVVIMKKHWYSFKRIITTVNDIVLFQLPVALSDYASCGDKITNDLFMDQFGNSLSILITDELNYRQSPIDYLWEFYSKTYIDIPDLFVNHQNSYRKLFNKLFSFKVPRTYKFLEDIQELKPEHNIIS